MTAIAPLTVLATAEAAYNAHVTVIPVREDGSKRPDLETWAQYQTERPTPAQMRTWFDGERSRSGIGVICGPAGLQGIDFDEHEIWEQYRAACIAAGLGPVIERVANGYSETTPNGFHVFFYCNEIGGNTKLAQRSKHPDEMKDEHDRIKTLIETRETGGYFVIAPSNGGVHETGQPYVLISGGIDQIKTISPEDRDALRVVARTFDQMPRTEQQQPARLVGPSNGQRPGDDFNARAAWGELLEPEGWAFVYERGDAQHWRRPGKRIGISATTNYKGSGLFYCFTTSATPFENDTSYSKFAVFTLLHHDGDYTAAAKALAAEGYGSESRGTINNVPNVLTNEPTSNTSSPETAPEENTKTASKGDHARDVDQDHASATPPVPAFPISVFSAPISNLLREGKAAYGVPADFIGVPLIALVGGTMGDSYRIEIKPGFEERPVVWTAVVAHPGSGKTPASSAARHAVDKLQGAARATYKEALQAHEQDMAAYLALDRTDRGVKPIKPVMEHFFTTDSTLEALAQALDSSAGLTLIRDEVVGFVKSFDAYRGGRGGDRQNWLSLWSSAPIKIDRKSDDPIYVTDPVACVTGGVQPEMLQELAEEAGRRDGFLERFLWGFPDSQTPAWTEDAVSAVTFSQVAEIFGKLRREKPCEEPVRLSEDAKALWVRWYNENVRLTADAPGLLAGVYSKLPVQLARLTLILWALSHADDPTAVRVDAATMSGAIELVEYFRACAHRVMTRFGLAAVTKAGGLAARCYNVLRRASGEWVTGTEMNRALGGHTLAADYEAALSELEEMGLVEASTAKAAGGKQGRPSKRWRLLADQTDQTEKRANDPFIPFSPPRESEDVGVL